MIILLFSWNLIICTVLNVSHSHWIELIVTVLWCTYVLLQLKERKKPIFVSEKKGCHLCHNTFSEPDVVCLPGGVPVHTHCVAQRVRDSPTKRQLTNSSNHTWDMTLQTAMWSVTGGTKIKQDCLGDCGDKKKHRTPIGQVESDVELMGNTKKAVCVLWEREKESVCFERECKGESNLFLCCN